MKDASANEVCTNCGYLRRPNEAQSMLDKLPPGSYVRQKLLMQLLPFSPATLWRKVASGDFPKPVKLSDRVTGWKVSEVRAWFQEKGLIRD